MPKTKLIFYANRDHQSPLKTWLTELPDKVIDKLIVRMERLEELGHELRRPEADYLRNGIYALRTSRQNVNYRILYFFHEQTAVLYNGLTKEGIVPPIEIERTIVAKELFTKNPKIHTYHESEENEN